MQAAACKPEASWRQHADGTPCSTCTLQAVGHNKEFAASRGGNDEAARLTQTSTATPRMPVAARRCSAALNHLDDA